VVPVLGRVSAGTSVFAIENIRERIPLPRSVVKKFDEKLVFAVRVQGDCLEGLHIIDGDLLICVQADAAENGDIVVVTVEGGGDEHEASTKRYREGDHGQRWLETVPMYPKLPQETRFDGKPRIIGVQISLFRDR
jgi:SOS-response transcriptional repressor LexA